ncbi:MAG: hypothetical protein PHP44_12950 [Kiritimatiellae bacterium]|nr:hypothetical protein [Kiritimatiellia bacterium]
MKTHEQPEGEQHNAKYASPSSAVLHRLEKTCLHELLTAGADGHRLDPVLVRKALALFRPETDHGIH